MAQLHVTQVPSLIAARWNVATSHPAALAAVPDALVQHLAHDTDACSAWAWHHDEQDGLASTAYQHERLELGPLAQVDVIDLPRPHRHNVVYVDRFHLIATGAPVAVAPRLAGLYVQTRGRLVESIHDRAGLLQVSQLLGQLPASGTNDELLDQLAMASRFCFSVLQGSDARGDLHADLRCPAMFAPHVTTALEQLRSLVAAW